MKIPLFASRYWVVVMMGVVNGVPCMVIFFGAGDIFLGIPCPWWWAQRSGELGKFGLLGIWW